MFSTMPCTLSDDDCAGRVKAAIFSASLSLFQTFTSIVIPLKAAKSSFFLFLALVSCFEFICRFVLFVLANVVIVCVLLF